MGGLLLRRWAAFRCRACRLWEISENLHRAKLTALERDKLVAEWVELTGEVSSQVATKGGRPESGARKAARDLGLDKDEVHRALKVASLSPEAQDAAREVGLDDNRSALLEARKQTTPDAQVEVLARQVRCMLSCPLDTVRNARQNQKEWGRICLISPGGWLKRNDSL